MDTEAGHGEHHYFRIQDGGVADGETIDARKHYIGIDAIRLYVNKKSNFLKKRMASGTVRIGLSDETYDLGLSLYELKEGAYTAPVFNLTLVGNRTFRGGDVTLRAFVGAIEQNTVMGELLHDMAKASLDVVSGALNTVSTAGPSSLLLAAGKSLTNGIQQILKTGKDARTILDPQGVSVTLNPNDLRGSHSYHLIHRGASLDPSSLSITTENASVPDLRYGGRALEDGHGFCSACGARYASGNSDRGSRPRAISAASATT